MSVADVLPPGIPHVEEVQYDVERAVRTEKCARYAEETVKRIYARMLEGQSLTDAVEADSVKVSNVREHEVNRSYFIPGLGSMNALVAKLFLLENPGDSTLPVITDSGSGIAVLVEKLPVAEEQYEKDSENLKKTMESELKSEVITRYIEGLKENAKIQDNRDMIVQL